MRLIDADEVMRDAEHISTFRANLAGLSDLAIVLCGGHTIEAEPVKHGKWFELTECSNEGVYCSVCHKKVYKVDYAWCVKKNKVRSNYCPNCGAKMDGDDNEQ